MFDQFLGARDVQVATVRATEARLDMCWSPYERRLAQFTNVPRWSGSCRPPYPFDLFAKARRTSEGFKPRPE